MLQQIALGGTMIALPIFLQMVLEQNAFQAGLTLTPLSLSMFFVALIAGRRAGRRRPSRIIQVGFLLAAVAALALIFVVPRADSGWWMVLPLIVMGIGLGLLVSQLNNYTLSPIEEERVSEAASVNSAAGSFGLSFGLAFAGALMLGTLAFSFDRLAHESLVLTPVEADQVSAALNENAEVMTNTHLAELLAGQPADIQAEIIRINTEARPRALQVALLVPLLAASFGFLSSFRMVRLPDPAPSEAAEMMVGG
jgi:MFS family permease